LAPAPLLTVSGSQKEVHCKPRCRAPCLQRSPGRRRKAPAQRSPPRPDLRRRSPRSTRSPCWSRVRRRPASRRLHHHPPVPAIATAAADATRTTPNSARTRRSNIGKKSTVITSTKQGRMVVALLPEGRSTAAAGLHGSPPLYLESELAPRDVARDHVQMHVGVAIRRRDVLSSTDPSVRHAPRPTTRQMWVGFVNPPFGEWRSTARSLLCDALQVAVN
jgi:hypothetical protein